MESLIQVQRSMLLEVFFSGEASWIPNDVEKVVAVVSRVRDAGNGWMPQLNQMLRMGDEGLLVLRAGEEGRAEHSEEHSFLRFGIRGAIGGTTSVRGQRADFSGGRSLQVEV